MTPDLLAALRETPGCGAMERGTDTGDVQHYFAAIGIGYGCDPCLTRLAEAVIEQVVARWPLDEVMMLRSYKPDIDTYEDVRRDVLASLLTALRSELTK